MQNLISEFLDCALHMTFACLPVEDDDGTEYKKGEEGDDGPVLIRGLSTEEFHRLCTGFLRNYDAQRTQHHPPSE